MFKLRRKFPDSDPLIITHTEPLQVESELQDPLNVSAVALFFNSKNKFGNQKYRLKRFFGTSWEATKILAIKSSGLKRFFGTSWEATKIWQSKVLG